MKFDGDIKIFLNEKYQQFCRPEFIAEDPISIPKKFHRKEDIEISGLITALISWGRRSAIISKANQLMQLMDDEPYLFVTQAQPSDLKRLENFVYRTFNASDLLFIVNALKVIYLEKGGLEKLAQEAWEQHADVKMVIVTIRRALLEHAHLPRTEKHLANPEAGSAAKRFNLYLRWMVRENTEGVDFGIWKCIPKSALMCPLDVHSARVARKLNLLNRTQNDWRAVAELTDHLKKFDSEDPVKYDFALFGMGVYEKF
ncbi:MAG: TIGR02757 family protein [Bacteroidales bacterium]|nr:TIGR02757 family protein [Bacteroidales bacterium]